MGQLNSLPFLWCEAGGRDYYCELAFPLAMANEGFEYLRSVLGPFNDRARSYVITMKEGVGFSIAYDLWDDESKKWRFEKVQLLERFENLALPITQRARSPV